MKRESWLCDIKGCQNEVPKENRKTRMDVIFTTEQTEGRGVPAYITNEKIDICASCKARVIMCKRYLVGHGAQGSNTFEHGGEQ